MDDKLSAKDAGQGCLLIVVSSVVALACATFVGENFGEWLAWPAFFGGLWLAWAGLGSLIK